MKKALSVIFLLAFTCSALATENLKLCEKEARLQLKEQGFNTKHPVKKLEGLILESGKTLSLYAEKIGPFADNKLVYVFAGKDYGGFEVATVINPSNCQMENLVVLYVE